MVGDVGYLAASIKDVKDTRVGDTITLANNPAENPLRIPEIKSDGLLRDVSGRFRKI